LLCSILESCISDSSNIINNTTNSANSKATADALFKFKLVIGGTEKRLEAVKNTGTECFGQNGADRNAPKVIT